MTNDITFWRLFAAALVLCGACVAAGGLLFALLNAVA